MSDVGTKENRIHVTLAIDKARGRVTSEEASAVRDVE